MGVVLADNVNAVKLVGNLDSESSGDVYIGGYREGSSNFSGVIAQAFTTGNNPEGYVITSVEINVSEPSSTLPALMNIRSSDYSNLYNLTGSVTSAGVQSFTAPANATLNASTTYFLFVFPGIGTGNFKVGVTDSNSEDSDSDSGWSVGDVSLYSNIGGFGFSESNDSLQLAVYGDILSDIPTNSFDLSGSNSTLRGLWSDGESMWVLDKLNSEAVAYDFSGGSLVRDSSKDFSVDGDSGSGVDADNKIVYIIDTEVENEYVARAYTLNGTPKPNKDIRGFKPFFCYFFFRALV